MTRLPRPVRVLLIWPGTEGASAGNFGVPQLVTLATYAEAMTGAEVHIRDLVTERGLGPVSLPRLLDGEDGPGRYDVVAFSIYSSFDYLKCHAIAELARQRLPEAVLVAGGYHVSARPSDIIYDGSPFDVGVIGEGEKPLVEVIESVRGGAPLRQQTLGPDPILDLNALPPTDWSHLDRYRDVARRFASQAAVYLSRGCPYECVFCMERAKREVSWRCLDVERAVDEIRSLHRYLDLDGWTLNIADALFGLRTAWRRELLAELARWRIPVDRFWFLTRLDLVEEEDVRLFAEARCSPGFGLESGDPEQLAIIHKTGSMQDYLERMLDVAEWARKWNVPWGANIIAGHPGETTGSLERTADYARRLFLSGAGTTGFLSVDPFRLYPGSLVDADLCHWEREHGTRFHRPRWWHDGDMGFLAEWVDPSAELSYRERETLQHRLFGPIVQQIEARFVHRGEARDYFLRSIRRQVQVFGDRRRLHLVDRHYAWLRYLGFGARADRERRCDPGLIEVARSCRAALLPEVAPRTDTALDDPLMIALECVPRELFVPVDRIAQSVRDAAVPLDAAGTMSVSALHAYAQVYCLLEVGPGDRVLDLGAGTGYGAALLSELVGGEGRVFAVEIDARLSEAARKNLEPYAVQWRTGDAFDVSSWGVDPREVRKVVVGFALEEIPASWTEALEAGVVIVAPLWVDGVQRLARATLRAGEGVQLELFERVRYVAARGSVPGEQVSEAEPPGARVARSDPR